MKKAKRMASADRKRISIKSFKSSDIDDFMLWVQRPEIYRFNNDVPPHNREDCKRLLRAHMAHLAHNRWFKSIFFNVDQNSVGAVSVTWQSGVDRCRAEIEFAVGPEFWRRGIATEAVRIATGEAFFIRPSLKRIEAIADVDNVAASRVLQKVGFQREGVLRQYYELKGNPRDMVMFSLLSKT